MKIVIVYLILYESNSSFKKNLNIHNFSTIGCPLVFNRIKGLLLSILGENGLEANLLPSSALYNMHCTSFR